MGSSRTDRGVSLITRARAHARAAAAVALLCCIAPAVPAGAQAPDDYWRSLRDESRPAVLIAAVAPPSVPQPLAEALRLIRVYELTADEGAARRARTLLRRSASRPGDRAWHALALAMVLARGPDSRMRDIGEEGDWYVDPNSLGSARSLRLLRALLEHDPVFREAALELATWALDREHPAVAAEAAIALARLPRDADVLLARASLDLLLGDFRRAASLAAEAERAGADPSLARHARAYALLQDPLTAEAGVEAYRDGARTLGEAGRAEYDRWLAPILTDAEAAEWRERPDTGAGAWLERFWRRSAARAGVTPDERLAEHYRRVHRARASFPSTAPLSVLQVQARFAIREDSRRFGLSLRGLMLLRHGDPFRLAHVEACLSDPFRGAESGVGIVCPGDAGARLALFQGAALLAAGDSFDPFARELGFGYGVYAFRGAAGATDLVFAVALPARSANALVEHTGDVAGLLSAILLPDTGDVIRVDSVFRAPLPARLEAMVGGRDDVLLVHASVPSARTGSFDYRVTVSDLARHAGGRGGGRIAVPDLGGFALSDLVVAPSDAAGAWRRGRVAVPLAPRRVYRPTESFRLYYEIYGLDGDTPYRTEIELVPARMGLMDRVRSLLGRDDAVRLRFDGRTPASHHLFGVQELRSVDLNGIEPGVWTLRVAVTDLASGRAIVRQTTIDVAAGN